MAFLLGQVKNMMKRYRDPDRIYRTRLKILSLDVSAAPGVKMLQFQGVVQSETKRSDSYTATVRFFDVKFSPEKMNTQHADIDVNGKQLFYPIPSIKRNPCQLKCDCQDFRFSFEKQNYDAGGLVGNWRRYKRVTPPAKRPPGATNPNLQGKDFVNAKPNGGDDVPGFCKHING
jgi:hypothetical protein